MNQEVFHAPGHLIQRSARLLSTLADQSLGPIGLSSAQIPILYLLKEGTARTQAELANLMRVEQPTMALLLKRMERDGLIARSPNPDDRRSSLVALTHGALAKLPHAKELMLAGRAVAFAGLSQEEIATLCGLLRRVVANLDPDAVIPEG